MERRRHWEDGRFVVCDGRHDYLAALMIGRDKLFVYWLEAAPEAIPDLRIGSWYARLGAAETRLNLPLPSVCDHKFGEAWLVGKTMPANPRCGLDQLPAPSRAAPGKPASETRAIGPKDKGRMHLYSSFINQHINAPRILIVESAFDPCNRSGLIRARDDARVLAILVWVNGRRFNVHQCHSARRSQQSAERKFSGSAGDLVR